MLAVILFRRHVSKGSDEHSGLRSGSFHYPSDSKINYLDDAIPVDHDVAGLDIAVNNAPFVGVIESHDTLAWRRRASAKSAMGRGAQSPARDSLPLPVPWRYKEVPRLPHIVDRDNIRMLQTARRLSLPAKAVKQVGILSDARRDGLERNQPVDDWIASTVNHTHGAVAKLSKNLVFAQLLQPAPLTVSSRSAVSRTARILENIQHSKNLLYETRASSSNV